MEIHEREFKDSERLEKYFAKELPWAFYPNGLLPVAEQLQPEDFPGVICVLGSLDGRKIVYAICKYPTSQIFFIERVAEYRKQGFASEIVQYILEKMPKDRDIDAMGGPMSKDAERLLERFGFKPGNPVTRKGTWVLNKGKPFSRT